MTISRFPLIEKEEKLLPYISKCLGRILVSQRNLVIIQVLEDKPKVKLKSDDKRL